MSTFFRHITLSRGDTVVDQYQIDQYQIDTHHCTMALFVAYHMIFIKCQLAGILICINKHTQFQDIHDSNTMRVMLLGMILYTMHEFITELHFYKIYVV